MDGFAAVGVRLAQAGQTIRVNVATGGAQSDEGAETADGPGSVSDDGRFVVFASSASDLVPDDTNGAQCGLPGSCTDVFVHDRILRRTERVSVSSAEAEANGRSSISGTISGDGRFVAFDSFASNLVPDDRNGEGDAFVRDRLLGTTERVSVTSDGSEGNGLSYRPVLSRDGRFVVFWSYADNLVANDTNDGLDVFVRDRATGTTERVSVSSTGEQTGEGRESYLGDISADGRFVAFASNATNLVPGDTNEGSEGYPDTDVFVRDRVAGTTERINVSTSGAQADGYSHFPSISADGRFVAFTSTAGNLVPGGPNIQCAPFPFCSREQEVYVRDRLLGITERVSDGPDGQRPNANCGRFVSPEISADGRFVVFRCEATNYVPGRNGGVFVKDLATGELTVADVASDGSYGEYFARTGLGISGDGRFVAFASWASNLVPDDTNRREDLFVHDRTCGDGIVDASEQCDDGNLLPGDGCEPTCTVEACAGGRPAATARLAASNAGVQRDRTLIRFVGTLEPPAVPAIAFDPQRSGVQLAIEDLGQPEGKRTIVDLAAPGSIVPSGGRGSGCDPRDGWASSRRGRVQTYLNRSDSADPPACTASSADGLRRLRLRDRREAGQGIEIDARVLAPRRDVVGPLRATLTLGADATAGCTVARFIADECSHDARRDEVRCSRRPDPAAR